VGKRGEGNGLNIGFRVTGKKRKGPTNVTEKKKNRIPTREKYLLQRARDRGIRSVIVGKNWTLPKGKMWRGIPEGVLPTTKPDGKRGERLF